MADGISDDWIKELEEELETINNSIKGKKSLQSVKVVADISTQNSREDLLNISKELFKFSKKVLNTLKKVPCEVKEAIPESDISALVRRELTDVLPGLLREVLKEQQSVPDDKKIKEEPTERHTLVLEKKTDGVDEEEDNTKMSEQEWTTVVKKDVKKTLKNVPVLNAKTVEGTAKLSFKTKEHMDSARDALMSKYKVTSKTQEKRMLEPKLTISDLDSDITSKEILEEKILEKNELIQKLKEEGDSFKVIFLDTEDKFAVLEVSSRMRQCIKKSDDRVCVDLQQHRVRDRFHVLQCFHCQGYGHMSGSPYCRQKDSNPICFYCAGSHTSRDCKRKKEKKVDSIKCYNCSTSRNMNEKNNCKTHNAANSLCPFFIREKERVMSRTLGSEDAKNRYIQRVKALQKTHGRA